MVLDQKRQVVCIFFQRNDAKHVVDELISAGFSSDGISIVAKDGDGNAPSSEYRTIDSNRDEVRAEAATGAVTGSMLGAIVGFLAGVGILTVPGVGWVIAGSIAGTTVVTTLTGFGIGAVVGSLISTLANLGKTCIWAEAASERFTQGEYLMIVEGTEFEVHYAEVLLQQPKFKKLWILLKAAGY